MADADNITFESDGDRDTYRQAKQNLGGGSSTSPLSITGTCDKLFFDKPTAPGSDYCGRHGATGGNIGQPDPQPFSVRPATGGENAKLRRDIARLEGKVDALLAALDVEVEDGDE